uniref:Uncharacterized protein n=1 Tax=Globisporangium ultimum (strain ATCC 200006 / CBS 805.95 / DAOM BR144) TaxID=431595 RepID=K3XCR8_GLOUD
MFGEYANMRFFLVYSKSYFTKISFIWTTGAGVAFK